MSKKHQQKPAVASGYARPGEGIVINSIHSNAVGTDGQVTQSISIDISTAQVPDRKYAAEVGGVLLKDDMIQFLFGQTKPIGAGLSSLLVIHIPFRAAHTFLVSLNSIKESATKYMEQFNVRPASLLVPAEYAEPSQTAVVPANLLAAAFSGREACIDFYHASSFAVHGFGLTGKFYAEPTVRVTLSLALLMALYDWLEGHKDVIPLDAPI